MIVIIRRGASESQLADLREQVRALGHETEVSQGSEGDLLVVLGDTRKRGLETVITDHPAAEKLIPILPHRRYERLFSRRSFLDVFLAGAAAVTALVCAGLAVFFFGRSGEERRQRGTLRVGAINDFSQRPYRLVDHKGTPIMVVRSRGGEFHAVSATCTHSEICQVAWSSERQELECPCHRAAFDLFGNVLHGPPPRPLRVYPVKVIGSDVYLKLRV